MRVSHSATRTRVRVASTRDRARKLPTHTPAKESAQADDSAIRVAGHTDVSGCACARSEKVCPLIGILAKYTCFCEKNDSEARRPPSSPPPDVELSHTLSVSVSPR